MKTVEKYLLTILAKPSSQFDLSPMLTNFTDEQIKNILINQINDKFFKKFENRPTANFENRNPNSNFEPSRSLRSHNNDNLAEIEIGLGSNDNVTQSDIRNYLLNIGKVDQRYLSKIKVLLKKSFVILPKDVVDNVMGALRDEKLNGKKVRMFVTQSR